MRNKVNLDEIVTFQSKIAEKASISSVQIHEASLEGMQKSLNQLFGFVAESLRLHLQQRDEQKHTTHSRATQLLDNL